MARDESSQNEGKAPPKESGDNKLVEGAEKKSGETWERETGPPQQAEPRSDGGPDPPGQGDHEASPSGTDSGDDASG